ncbi:TonB-dependent siderophore receptor [Oceanibaculum indicum]|uniref:Iron complex outermembrane receptor protein n=1 Tax=Oceanibaculum indicum TaxID=526216 RepID=A0A420WRM6_9PROT|nr:TonB-dependent siderophore receptor [Oceanibaculum indicum]RKQ73496.1 iron complex outermembrane receptor protein [Oceanibaculum indicum]
MRIGKARGGIGRGKQGWRDLLLMGTALVVLAHGTPAIAQGQAAQTAQAQEIRSFQIPAQPLPAALRLFADQAGLQLAYKTDELQALTGNPVAGSYRTEDALRLLLSGRGVSWRFTDARTVVLERIAAGDAMTLDPVTVEGKRVVETGKGAFDGYVATRSTAGTKTDTPLIETPQSISVVGSEQIDRLKPQTVGEALRYTPGLLKGQGFNRTDDGFYMRGFQVNHESLYMDGLRGQPNIYSTSTEPYALERIEVLRGPASVLYGQAGPGGVINMVSKRPTEDALHEVQFQAGNFERKQVATDHAGKLDAEGKFTYRLTALARDSDTMVDHIPDDKAFIAPSLTWKPTDDTSLTLLTSYTKAETAYYYGFPAEGTVLPNPNGEIARDRFLGEPDYNKWDRTVYSAGYEFEHRFADGLQFRQNLRYSDFKNEYKDIGFGSWQPGQRVINRSAYERVDDSSMFAVDNQMLWDVQTGPLAHKVLAGLDYTRGTFERVQYSGTVAPLDLYAPVYGAPVTRSASPVTSVDQSYDQFGVYLQDQIKFDEKWVLLLGGRQDWVEDESLNRLNGARTSNSQDAFTGRVGLVYLSETGLAPYVSYSESFQPQAGVQANGSSFVPTTGQQYEAGVKYQPPGRDSSVTVAVYELTRQNVVTSDPANPGFSVQTGEIQSRGFEVEAKLNLAKGLNLLASYTYTDAEVTKTNGTDLGNRPTNTPQHMASLWGEYALQEPLLRGLTLGAGLRYVGDTVNLADTYTAPSYTVYDAMVGYELGQWELALNVINLTDEKYIATCTYGCFYGDARTVMATVSYHW